MRQSLCLLGGLAVFASFNALSAEVTGTQVADRVDRVMKAYDWQESLAAAKEKAQREKKLVFWLQLVGELNGGL